MPPPATDFASAEHAASLEEASTRLEAALARLEALVEVGPLQAERFREGPASPSGAGRDETLATAHRELAAARTRGQDMEAAATAASDTLDRAMAEIRNLLHTDVEDASAKDDADQTELDLDIERSEESAS